jgi:hypothetical protein
MIECHSCEPILENVLLPVEQSYADTPATPVVGDNVPVNTYTTIVTTWKWIGY